MTVTDAHLVMHTRDRTVEPLQQRVQHVAQHAPRAAVCSGVRGQTGRRAHQERDRGVCDALSTGAIAQRAQPLCQLKALRDDSTAMLRAWQGILAGIARAPCRKQKDMRSASSCADMDDF